MNRFTLLTLFAAFFALLLLPVGASAQFGGIQPTHPAPRLWLTTRSIDIAVPELTGGGSGPVAEKIFKFGNRGYANLQWRLYFGSDFGGCAIEITAGWISVAPGSGTIAPGGNGAAQVSVNDATGGPGSYSALLCMETNDPNAALVAIPVTVHVE